MSLTLLSLVWQHFRAGIASTQPLRQRQMSTLAAVERARAARPELAAIHSQAVEAATQRYAAETAARAR